MGIEQPPRRGRWKRRIFIVVASLVAVYFALPIADRLWYAIKTPSKYRDTQWSGDWHSDQFSLVSGRILAHLPDPIPRDEEFDVDALVYYRIWNPYRTGCFVPMKMVGFLPSYSSGGGGGNADAPVVVPAHVTFKFKGGGPSEQTIDYVATTDSHTTMFVGGYRSAGPYDMGRFALARR
jgi:hypothetical protein